jgi:hypothetical protein
MKFNKKRTSGLTLIEGLIWFAIFAAVVAGTFQLYSKSRESVMIGNVNQEISTMFSKIDKLYEYESTASLNAKLAYDLGAVPKSVKAVSNQTVYKNQFGGDINIVGIAPAGFLITYTKIPYGKICAGIIAGQRQVGWNYVLDNQGNRVNYDENYTISKVAAACKTEGSGSVEFSFYYTPNA